MSYSDTLLKEVRERVRPLLEERATRRGSTATDGAILMYVLAMENAIRDLEGQIKEMEDGN